MKNPGSTPRGWTLALVLALLLPWAMACDDGGALVGPDAAAEIEGIPEAEIVAAGELADLTDEQRRRVRAILREARRQLIELRRAVRAGEVPREAARERARQIHQETIQKLSEILTDEQV
ncbi:MAG: hypothetical protein R3326_08330, partial [Gemmatimonadota bacterium]|nr:hypothetical protein [Gemmatimonadota bacterium]